MPSPPRSPDLLARAGKFFPAVGLVIGGGGALLHLLLIRVLAPSITALIILTFLVVITGGLHEDALADAADGFGGGWGRERVLEIMRDSRIGSFGGLAIGLSLLWRYMLLLNLPEARFTRYLLAANVLSRWTSLPLSYALAPARAEGSGVTIAQRTSATGLVAGSILTLIVVIACLGIGAWVPVSVTVAVVILSGWYYQRRLAGVTGDCFGATNQISEIAVYFCGCAFSLR